MTIPGARPSGAVVAAFGAQGAPVPLAGGKGGTWRAGGVALKPVEFLPETLWRAEVLSAVVESDAFRVARPVRAAGGGWVVEGWEAGALVPGVPDTGRQDEVLAAAAAFHAAVAGVPRPAFLDEREDPWSLGDRFAWEEASARVSPEGAAVLEPLLAARRPVDLPAQAVHGDLPGNVLFADGLPPAVIDWPVYWRPPAWACAVAVVDALCWYGAPPALADRWSHLPEWGQMLVRALVYRVVTHDAVFGRAGWSPRLVERHRPVVALAVAHAGARRAR